ncbi:MAG: crossover junction endodeoxyribonuclease RuvC [Actinomycetota bacterium]|nr:crossover junction endodeoxyribonuclease RuvC [Actinomycetota bacterium]
MTVILGIDPGLTRLGVGVISHGPGRTVKLVHVDVYTTPPGDDPAARIGALSRRLETVLDEYRPDVVALERVFAQHNVRTVMGTAQISGVVLALAHARAIPVSLRTPSEVKAAVTGHGRASKAQVGSLVQAILGLDEIPKPADAADALALAITEAWRGVAPGSGSAKETLTPAQQAWREAEVKAKRPRLK